MSPLSNVPEDISFDLPLTTPINQIKAGIHDKHSVHPTPAQQKLIFRGKILDDRQHLGEVLSLKEDDVSMNANQESSGD